MMKQDVLVSIIVPVYNMEKSLYGCIKKILTQTYCNLEVILVDDGSKDNSGAVCDQIQTEDSRVKAFHTSNQGSGPARNYGIKQSSGKYIYFPDADDFLKQNAIEVLVDAAERTDSDLIVFGYESLDLKGKKQYSKIYKPAIFEGETVRNDYSEFMATSSSYPIQGAPWNKFFSRQIISDNQVFYPPLRRHQDEAFIANYVNFTKRICFVSEQLYVHILNDLKLEWKKYPKDYLDVVIELFETRKRTILLWNKKDTKTRNLVYVEYICKIIKALELFFSPKLNLKGDARKKRIIDGIKKSKIADISISDGLGRYQTVILNLIRRQKFGLVFAVLWAKVFVEKFGFLKYIKRAV